MTCVGMTGDDDYSCSTGALYVLLSGTKTQRRLVQAHYIPNLKARLAREAARLPLRSKVLRDKKESRTLLPSASEEDAVGRRSVQRRKLEREDE